MLSEAEISTVNPVVLRWHEAAFFLAQYEAASGPPKDSYFAMISYLDAFLRALASVRELSAAVEGSQLTESAKLPRRRS